MSQRLIESRGLLRPLLSVLVGLALAALLMQLSGYHAGTAYGAMWTGGTGLEAGPARNSNDLALGFLHINKYHLGQSLAKVTPLLFIGLAVALGLRAGLFNIGAQGQMTLGALAAAVVGEWGAGAKGTAGLSPLIHLPLALLAGTIVGALWSALAGLLKAARGVHEVIATIMLNLIAADLAKYLILHGLGDPASQNPQTPMIAPSARLPALLPPSDLTLGLLLALAAAVALTFLIRRTSLGYEIRAVGLNAEAARAGGIPVPRITVLTMALSGALAGLAGAVEVLGVHHRYVEGVAGSYGFDGIAVALLGGLSGGGVVLSALFFGMLANGAAYMELTTHPQVPAPISAIVQAVVIIFVGMRPRGKTVAPAAADTEERPNENAPR